MCAKLIPKLITAKRENLCFEIAPARRRLTENITLNFRKYCMMQLEENSRTFDQEMPVHHHYTALAHSLNLVQKVVTKYDVSALVG